MINFHWNRENGCSLKQTEQVTANNNNNNLKKKKNHIQTVLTQWTEQLETSFYFICSFFDSLHPYYQTLNQVNIIFYLDGKYFITKAISRSFQSRNHSKKMGMKLCVNHLYLLKVVVLCTEYNLHKANFFTLLFNLDFSSILPFLFFSIYNKLKQNSADIDQVSWWHWYSRQNDMGKKICQSFHWHPDYKPKRVATDMWDRWEVKKPGTVGCMHG